MQNAQSNIAECPCCGQPVEGTRLLIDDNSNTLARGTMTVRFTPRQYKLAKFLVEKFPSIATKDQIYETAFMDATGDGPEMKIVDVMICKIRPLMAELGLVIDTVWGVGYRLVEAGPLEADEIKDAGIRARGRGAAHRWQESYSVTLKELMGRGLNVTQCASIMKLPYATVERHMKRLREEQAHA